MKTLLLIIGLLIAGCGDMQFRHTDGIGWGAFDTRTPTVQSYSIYDSPDAQNQSMRSEPTCAIVPRTNPYNGSVMGYDRVCR